MISKVIKAAAVAAIVATAGYWYWSPFLTVRQLQLAAQKRDAVAFNAHVDYPRLRESIKSQYSDRLSDKFGKAADADNDFAKLGAAVGNLIGRAVVNPVVDAMVRPEIIMQAMQSGHLSITVKDSPPSETPPKPEGNSDGQAAPERKDDKPKWVYERKGVNQVIAYATDLKKPDAQNQDKFGLVLQRSGFATWKLSEVRLPALNK
jgi:hypothetical protein